MLQLLRKRKSNNSDKSYISWAFLDKVTSDIDLTDKIVAQYDVPVAKNTLVHDGNISYK